MLYVDKKYSPSVPKLDMQFRKQGVIALQSLQLPKNEVLARLTEMTIVGWKSRFGNESDIYVITLVVDSGKQSKDPHTLELKTFPHIRRGDKLTIGPYGVLMYSRIGYIPAFLDMRILVARNRQKVRDAGAVLASVGNDSDFKSAVAELSALAAGPIGIITTQAEKIVGIIGKILQLTSDDKLLYYAATLSRDFDEMEKGISRCEEERYVKFCYKVDVHSKTGN